MINVLNKTNSVLNNFLFELRSKTIQTDSMRFRRNLERIGEVMAYEISKSLPYKSVVAHTPLDDIEVFLPSVPLVVATVLRAGLPLQQGFLNYFDAAGSAFISAHRAYDKNNEVAIQFESMSTPSLEGKILFLVDPMLATGSSLVTTYRQLIAKAGTPLHTHIACVVSSLHGADYLEHELPQEGVSIWTAALDPSLNAQAYIVPGLGDAGDLAFGTKL